MNAPEQIWAFYAPEIAENENGATIVAHETVQHGAAPYIRADLFDAKEAEIADLRRQLADREAQVARLLEMQIEREVDHENHLAEARDKALEEAAHWLDSQMLTDDELRQGYGFTVDYPAVAAKAILALKGAAK